MITCVMFLSGVTVFLKWGVDVRGVLGVIIYDIKLSLQILRIEFSIESPCMQPLKIVIWEIDFESSN